MVGLSVGEKHFIQGGIAQDLRTDGRKRLTYRPIFLQTGVIAQVNINNLVSFNSDADFVMLDVYLCQANGSARGKMGTTEVIASVKVSFVIFFFCL